MTQSIATRIISNIKIPHFHNDTHDTLTEIIENMFRISMPAILTHNLVFVFISKMSNLDS